MHLLRSTAAALLVTAAAALAASETAAADTVVVADPTAQNLTSYAGTSAWSRRAADGSYRLVVMAPTGGVTDAHADASSVPFDPDLGPTSGNGRAIVYSRCATGSTTSGCDVYLYDVGAGTERKLSSVSGRTTSELGPSYFKGTIAFGRSGARAGLYVKDPGRAARRIWSARPDQTDLSASRVISRAYVHGESIVRVSGRDGKRARNVGSGMRGEEAETVVSSPVLARYRAFWLYTSREFGQMADGVPAQTLVETVSTRSASRPVGRVNRPFATVADSFGLGPASVPQLFSGSGGVSRVDPPFVIPS
jgi:hypothetical protein